MKHIEKGSEPTEFTQWKDCVNDPENVGWRPAWGNFQNPEKTMVHNSLLLKKNRKNAIRAFITDDSSVSDLKLLQQIFSQRDAEGKFQEYSVALQQLLRQYGS